MEAQIQENLIQTLAKQAACQLTSDQLSDLAIDLSAILTYMKQLEDVDVCGVTPLYQVYEKTLPLREDVVLREPEKMVQSATDVLYDSFKVPPIL